MLLYFWWIHQAFCRCFHNSLNTLKVIKVFDDIPVAYFCLLKYSCWFLVCLLFIIIFKYFHFDLFDHFNYKRKTNIHILFLNTARRLVDDSETINNILQSWKRRSDLFKKTFQMILALGKYPNAIRHRYGYLFFP